MALVLQAASTVTVAAPPDPATARTWVEEMKTSARGPFARIRWFCNDGAILPPQPYGCAERGGGNQHGEWTERVRTLRDAGYRIANVYADLDVDALMAAPDHRDQIAQMVIEQFLVEIDDGWILRRARFYRGALQEEGERAGARRLLLAMAARERFVGIDLAMLRTAARLLPHGAETRTVAEVRRSAAALAAEDTGFQTLRNKIHVRPEAADAAAVRAYAARLSSDQAAPYTRLADAIESAYSPVAGERMLRALAARRGAPAEWLGAAADRLAAATTPTARLAATAEVLVEIRDRLGRVEGPELRLAMIDASLAVESEHFVAGTALIDASAPPSRAERLGWLRTAVDALYGAALVSARQRDAMTAALTTLATPEVAVTDYKRVLDYVALLPAWGTQRLRLHFGEAARRLGELEPKVELFVPDQLRGSPLFATAQNVDTLLRDANHLAGVRNELFGEDVGAGLRSLNPGLARGRLEIALGARPERFTADGIYLLPETEADLPPVAGILTAGEGNPLSHVQLLARNLGIPNVAVDTGLLPRLGARAGAAVVLAVSPAGSVRLALDDPSFDAVFGAERAAEVLIRPDLVKLDLTMRDLLPLSRLRATDSGRVVGPKAAKLGELLHHYPDAVADGLAIPFGVFREMLERPFEDTGKSAFDWMVERYRHLETLPEGSTERRDETEAFRARLERWVGAIEPGAEFRERLRAAMTEVFGADGTYGVFVRSDTNVEDLPGFTGAGLNLTVPNVVGFDRIWKAIPRVWASPFTARAFSWRQAHMDRPEHVYPAVLLLRSVPAEKSGVMVTQDVDSGSRQWLSIAVNEGVGGAVDGQAAESLRVNVETGEVRLMAQATAPIRRQVDPAGGVTKLPVSGADTVLAPAEIAQLVELARGLPTRFPEIVDDQGAPAPADIEFGFLDGRLALFQIRPFLESRRARGSAYLNALDEGLAGRADDMVRLDRPPGDG
ncbi:MAG: phosphoenolpyruvate synthase [Ectothiorhodospiraceae bacterium]|nr:phosphoenolpyruvate synthase [Chromatiales bacterium]MCP5156016.1 phosphoenolpyruvate synthase [Ectothiorhodospiraceae bacterium]